MGADEKWKVKQTHQGAWVMLDNGHLSGPESETIAMAYFPMVDAVEGATMEARVTAAEELMTARVMKMAAAPELIRALRLLCCETHACRENVDDCGHCVARAALKKAGVSP